MKMESTFDKFSSLLGKLAKVPHDEVKAKLEAEKKNRRKRAARAKK
jgi:hypothetical protein